MDRLSRGCEAPSKLKESEKRERLHLPAANITWNWIEESSEEEWAIAGIIAPGSRVRHVGRSGAAKVKKIFIDAKRNKGEKAAHALRKPGGPKLCSIDGMREQR